MPTKLRFRHEWTLAGCAYALVIGVALGSCGCATTAPDDRTALSFASKGARNAQLGLSALMLVDTAQTVTIARNPDCLSEGNQIAAAIFGTEHPSPSRVLITNAVYIAAHWALGAFLDRKAETIDFDDLENDHARRQRWKLARNVYQVATGFGHGFAVTNNHSIGIKPFSQFTCGAK